MPEAKSKKPRRFTPPAGAEPDNDDERDEAEEQKAPVPAPADQKPKGLLDSFDHWMEHGSL